jgi:hypothetical protein
LNYFFNVVCDHNSWVNNKVFFLNFHKNIPKKLTIKYLRLFSQKVFFLNILLFTIFDSNYLFDT